jgi:hypothetical protein
MSGEQAIPVLPDGVAAAGSTFAADSSSTTASAAAAMTASAAASDAAATAASDAAATAASDATMETALASVTVAAPAPPTPPTPSQLENESHRLEVYAPDYKQDVALHMARRVDAFDTLQQMCNDFGFPAPRVSSSAAMEPHQGISAAARVGLATQEEIASLTSYTLSSEAIARLVNPDDLMVSEYVAFVRAVGLRSVDTECFEGEPVVALEVQKVFRDCVVRKVLDLARARLATVGRLAGAPALVPAFDRRLAAAGVAAPLAGHRDRVFAQPKSFDRKGAIAGTSTYAGIHAAFRSIYGGGSLERDELAYKAASQATKDSFYISYLACAESFAFALDLDLGAHTPGLIGFAESHVVERANNFWVHIDIQRRHAAADRSASKAASAFGRGEPHFTLLAVGLAVVVALVVYIVLALRHSLAARLHRCGWQAFYQHGAPQWSAQRKIIGRGAARVGSPCKGESACADGQPLVWVNSRTGDTRAGVLSKSVLGHMCAK